MAIVDVSGLSFTYSGTEQPAIRDINIRVESGEFILLVGPSGCGKSTLCRCLNGLIPHFHTGEMKGRVLVMGKDTATTPTFILSQDVGFVFQNPENQLFALSVENDVAFALENLGYPRDEIRGRVDFALRTVGIESLRNKSPFELSGGQQQRVAIASVLAMEPSLMIFDEPTSFLDPLSAQNLIRSISEIQDTTGMAVVLVEHRLDLAARYATRIVVMESGRIVDDGPPAEVLAQDETEVFGVGIPKIVKLAKTLNKDLRIFNQLPLTVEEASKKIKGVLV
ncbi:MAG: energy-coupling factor ABC transporter ATP-binding protein [Nitrososphaeria archaeon]